jgi:hypothetical protein
MLHKILAGAPACSVVKRMLKLSCTAEHAQQQDRQHLLPWRTHDMITAHPASSPALVLAACLLAHLLGPLLPLAFLPNFCKQQHKQQIKHVSMSSTCNVAVTAAQNCRGFCMSCAWRHAYRSS